MAESEKGGDRRTKRALAIEDGRQAATAYMPNVDGIHTCDFESSQFEDL